MKLLTVVVPAYNAETYLRKNLDSFCFPEPPEDLEILVINDGSTDKTGEIAEEYTARYPDTVRVIHKANGGHGSGINWGIAHAAGLYFKVVDADDWVDREGFAELMYTLRGLADQPTDIIYSGFLWAMEDEWDIETFHLKRPEKMPFRGVIYGKVYRFDEVADKIYIRMHNMTIRTAILREHGIRVDEHCYYVDKEYVAYPIPWVRTICFIDADVYRYRIGRSGQSVEIGQMQKNEKDYDKVADSLLRFYGKLGGEIPCTPARTAYICRLLSIHAAGKIKIILSHPSTKERKQQLKQFDKQLKERYPEIYSGNQNPAVSLLRRSGYHLYGLAGWLVRRKYRQVERGKQVE